MPSGTIYSTYSPCVFNGFYVKGQSLEDIGDFTESSLIGNPENNSSDDFIEKCDAMVRGESVPIDVEYFGREGFFDDTMQYAVYEKEDVKKIIEVLKNSLLTHCLRCSSTLASYEKEHCSQCQWHIKEYGE